MTFAIHHGDTLARLRQLPDNSIDAVLMDPPFCSGTRKEAAKGLRKSMLPGREDAEWFDGDSLTVLGFAYLMREVARESRRVMKPGASLLSFIDWRMMPHLAAAIESSDLRSAGLLVWDKTYFGMGQQFRHQHELVLHFTKEQGWDPQRSDVPNVIACPPIRGGDHPNEKPVPLLRRILSVVCPPGGRVLDPFSGSASTGVACVLDGYDFVGIDSSAYWVAFGLHRCAEAVISGRQQSIDGLTA